MEELAGLEDGRFTRGEEEWKPFSVEGIQADFYVALNGNDSWSGRLPEPNREGTDGPFATLKRAQEAVRILKKEIYKEKKTSVEPRYIGSYHKYGRGRDILVLIRGGYYLLEEPLYFGPEDGGERCETDAPSGAFEFNLIKDYYVTYAAYPGEVPVIVGGKKIDFWQKEEEKLVTYLKGIKVEKLFVNGKEQILARTPNIGYFEVAETPINPEEFRFYEGDIKKWPNMEGNRIVFLLRWHIGINSIKEIDEERNIAKLERPQEGITEVPPRYYIENIEALLDAPGEWYFDVRTGKLSLIPEVDINNPNKAFIVVPTLSNLIVLKGDRNRPVRNLRFCGLYFHATTSGGSAISFEYARNCELLYSNITGIGGTAIMIGKGCYGTRIYKNTINGTDGDGIYIIGIARPENWADIIDNTFVSYNRISNCSGRSIYAANNLNTTISHNEVKDTRGRFAVYVGGWHNIEEVIDGGYKVEYNHIHHALTGADDSGAIVTAGQTSNSIIRKNLIHDIYPSFFNENVAIWFDNWSAGWQVEDNIYYNLKQAPMKLCAAYLSDNVYRDNFYIEEPVKNEPEDIIEGEPRFEYGGLEIDKRVIKTGETVRISCTVRNSGATGIKNVGLFVDNRLTKYKKFPVVHNNERVIEFKVKFHRPGIYKVSIGSLDESSSSYSEYIEVIGKELQVDYGDLKLSEETGIIPYGDEIDVEVNITNITDEAIKVEVPLYLNQEVVQTKIVELSSRGIEEVKFTIKPDKGVYNLRIGDSASRVIKVYEHYPVDISRLEWRAHIAARSKPGEFRFDLQRNHFEITASGTDFFHAEDSYGAIYLEKVIKGNFIAIVKVIGFEGEVNPWFRAGIFLRNEISKNFEVKPGSLGSVLVFITPKVGGIHWDEFGDGCMHQSGSKVKLLYEPTENSPIWLKMMRHGDSFSGFISYDGEGWIKIGDTRPVPGLAMEMDIGLAAGSIDRRSYKVIFEDFKLEIEKENKDYEV